jgi:hypothetical protein
MDVAPFLKHVASRGNPPNSPLPRRMGRFSLSLRMLLCVLAVGPPILAGAWWIRAKLVRQDYIYELYHNPAKYGELEEWLIKEGKCRRGSNGELLIVPQNQD